jgi:hypothetical protein
MTRQTGSPGVELPELHVALAAYLAQLPALALEPEVLVQDALPGMEAPIPAALPVPAPREPEQEPEPALF